MINNEAEARKSVKIDIALFVDICTYFKASLKADDLPPDCSSDYLTIWEQLHAKLNAMRQRDEYWSTRYSARPDVPQ